MWQIVAFRTRPESGKITVGVYAEINCPDRQSRQPTKVARFKKIMPLNEQPRRKQRGIFKNNVRTKGRGIKPRLHNKRI
jgi:hypothetical protein